MAKKKKEVLEVEALEKAVDESNLQAESLEVASEVKSEAQKAYEILQAKHPKFAKYKLSIGEK